MPKLGNKLGVQYGSAISVLTYWKTQNEVLFFVSDPVNVLNKVIDGKIYNKKSGATDYLTVTGEGLNARYRTPDTAPYKAADTDYCWWKTDASESTCDGNRLIGYDFTRTIVKYSNIAPHVITGIMILSSDVDTPKMRNDFDLSIWWSNVASDYGNEKANRIGQKSVWTAEATPEEESINLFTRMTTASETPSEARQALINTAIKGLKDASLWAKIDGLWLLAAHGEESSLLNWISDNYNLIPISTPAFEVDRGYTGGAGKALRTGIVPSAGGFNYILDSAALGGYSRTNSSGDRVIIGAQNSDGTKSSVILPRYTDNKMYMRLNSAAANQVSATNMDSTGLYLASRNASNSLVGYKNTTPTTSAHLSSALTEYEFYILATNKAGAVDEAFTGQVALAFVSSKLTNEDVTAFNTIMVDGFLNSIGAKI